MDKFLEIVFPLLMVVLFAVPSIIKGAKKDVSPPKMNIPPDDFEENDFELEIDSDLHKTEANIPKEKEYFTYDDIGSYEDISSNRRVENPIKDPSVDSQIVDNEDKNIPEVSFDMEDLYKGVIYSEILKKKY